MEIANKSKTNQQKEKARKAIRKFHTGYYNPHCRIKLPCNSVMEANRTNPKGWGINIYTANAIHLTVMHKTNQFALILQDFKGTVWFHLDSNSVTEQQIQMLRKMTLP